jgi:hypothetical protein
VTGPLYPPIPRSLSNPYTSIVDNSRVGRAYAVTNKQNANGTSSSQCTFPSLPPRSRTRFQPPHHPNREKYVTRAEYDELKARFEQLEQTVSSLFRTSGPTAPLPPPPTAATNTGGNVPPQYYQMSMSGGMPGGPPPPTNLPSYNPQPHQQSGMYPMLPPGSFIQPTQPQHHRYSGPDSPRTVTSPRHMSMQQQQQQQHSPATSPVVQTAPSPSRNPKSPQSAKNSPLSLASITTPYNTNTNTTTNTTTGGGGGGGGGSAESQSKNYQRRRTLGVRLRLVTPHEDPVVRCNGAPRWRHPQRARKNLWLGARVILVVVCRFRDSSSSSSSSILGGLAMLLRLWCHLEGMWMKRGRGWDIIWEIGDGMMGLGLGLGLMSPYRWWG